MKKTFLFHLFILFILAGCLTTGLSGPAAPGIINVSGKNPKPVTTLYGENYWCWNNYGDRVKGTETLVADLKLKVLRAGGYNNDAQKGSGFDPFDHSQIDRFIAYCRAVGAEPIMQVSLLKNISNGRATAGDAADMVTYCNKTRDYNIKYWEIGNEPDLYSDLGDRPGYTVTDFCSDFNAFSIAMKAADPSIKILGPELSWKYYPKTGGDDWLTPFIQNCKGHFDIVSIHRYPFSASQSTIENAMADAANFNKVVDGVRSLMNANGLSSVPLAITEANISWDGDPSHSNYSASPQTFYAALWVADTLGEAIQQGLWAYCFWSISEGWTLSFIDGSSKEPKPNYYAYWMFTNNFGTKLLSATAPLGFSVYASRNENDDTILIVINKNSTNNEETLKFSGFSTALPDQSYKFPAYSITCLTIPDNGNPIKILSYTKDQADQGKPPLVINKN